MDEVLFTGELPRGPDFTLKISEKLAQTRRTEVLELVEAAKNMVFGLEFDPEGAQEWFLAAQETLKMAEWLLERLQNNDDTTKLEQSVLVAAVSGPGSQLSDCGPGRNPAGDAYVGLWLPGWDSVDDLDWSWALV